MPLELLTPTDSQLFSRELNITKEYVNGLMTTPPPEYLEAVAYYISTQVEIVTEDTYEVTSEDHNKIKDFTNASGCTVTVPSGLVSPLLGVPFTCGISKGGTGDVIVVAGLGAIVNSPNGIATMDVRYGLMTLTEWPDGTYRLYGGTITV